MNDHFQDDIKRNDEAAMREQWLPLNEWNIPESDYVLNRHSHDDDGLRLELECDQYFVDITFTFPVVYLVTIDEEYRAATWKSFATIPKGHFFKIENSRFLNAAMVESHGYDRYRLKQHDPGSHLIEHYVILADKIYELYEVVIDIISYHKPEVSIKEKTLIEGAV